jgi:contractile injection system tape measure protein
MLTTIHRVRRQRWRVRAVAPDAARAVRGRLAGPVRDRLHAVFERAFDRACPVGQVVRVPRLELRLRVDPGDESLESLDEAIARQVAEALRLAIDRTHAQSEAHAARSTTMAWSRLESLVAYLESGSLPWPVAGLGRGGAVLEELRGAAVRDLPTLLERAHRSGDRSQAFLFRLLQLLPEDRWVAVAHDRGADPDQGREQVEDFLAAVAGIAAGAGLSRHRRIEIAVKMITATWRGPGRQGAPTRAGATLLSAPDLPEAVVRYIRRWLDGGDRRVASRRTAGARAGGVRAAAVEGEAAGPEIPAAPAPFEERAPLESREDGASEPGRPVRHAGLILLHPYLEVLFARTAIRAAGEPRLPAEHRPRAAALLHYLATGEDEPHEFDLGFIKILLGGHPEESLPVSGGLLLPSDIQEAGTLLRSALEHWSALKTTSVEGLRATFLRRQGFVSEERWCWRMRVPAEPFDVLLKQLPWTMGIVKLAWMTRGIETDWQMP